MVEKSQNAYRNIREASELLGLEPHVLRFWESKFAELQPMTRGGGRRFYSPDDLALLKTIRVLLHDQGLTIKAASRLVSKYGVAATDYAIANDRVYLRQEETPKPSLLQRLREIDRILEKLQHNAERAIEDLRKIAS